MMSVMAIIANQKNNQRWLAPAASEEIATKLGVKLVAQ